MFVTRRKQRKRTTQAVKQFLNIRVNAGEEIAEVFRPQFPDLPFFAEFVQQITV